MTKKKSKLTLPACVIAAGGKGRRLGAITKNVPKPAIKINKIPFIIHQLKWLIKCGFKEFCFILSYKKSKIEKIIEKFFSNQNLNYLILQDKGLGTYSAIVENLKKLNSEFFYTNADEISYFNIRKMYSNFKSNKSNLMCCVLEDEMGYLNLNIKEKRIEKKHSTKKRSFKDCGYKFIKKKIFFKGKKKNYKKLEQFIYSSYLKKNIINFHILKNMPYRIDTLKDISITKKKLKK